MSDVILNRGEAAVKDLTTDAGGTEVNEIVATARSEAGPRYCIVATRCRKVLRRGFAASQDDIIAGFYTTKYFAAG